MSDSATGREIRACLFRARGRIARGWGRDGYRIFVDRHPGSVRFRKKGVSVCFCAAGALRVDPLSDPTDPHSCWPEEPSATVHEALRALCKAIPLDFEDGADHYGAAAALGEWNDAEERTHEEVLEAFTRAFDYVGRDMG